MKRLETGRFDNDPVPSLDDLRRRYAEAVFTIDENVGKLLKYLDHAQVSKIAPLRREFADSTPQEEE